MGGEELPSQLEELARLWIDASSESLRRIPALCRNIEDSTLHFDGRTNLDRTLLDRVGLLSAEAEKRMTECLAIHSRTGSYSPRGSIEISSRVATLAWEG